MEILCDQPPSLRYGAPDQIVWARRRPGGVGSARSDIEKRFPPLVDVLD